MSASKYTVMMPDFAVTFSRSVAEDPQNAPSNKPLPALSMNAGIPSYTYTWSFK
ncbi:hypothetical protein DPMN_070324 [Dreissena polymorpha]|uniref:Uncharacterized protein n=1 Tax=Dreissena polymorpha TaxID=45954 RepID=A0A9D3Z2Y9_DREPO|nr:hypothetical protein DPMN_070324 [Dreissena polymorpha]